MGQNLNSSQKRNRLYIYPEFEYLTVSTLQDEEFYLEDIKSVGLR